MTAGEALCGASRPRIIVDVNTGRHCNTALAPIERTHVRGLVPEFVFQTQDRFHRCPECRRLYWQGTHWRTIVSELAGMTKGS